MQEYELSDNVDDMIDAMMQKLAQLGFQIPENIVESVNQEFRNQFGGEQVYLNRERPVDYMKRDEIIRKLHGNFKRQICNQFKINHSTYYRALNTKEKNRDENRVAQKKQTTLQLVS